MTEEEAIRLLQRTQRRVALCGHVELVLTPRRAFFYNIIKTYGETTAAKLASDYGRSVQNMSGTLTRMYRDGFLTRTQEPQESGGYEWRYSISGETP